MLFIMVQLELQADGLPVTANQASSAEAVQVPPMQCLSASCSHMLSVTSQCCCPQPGCLSVCSSCSQTILVADSSLLLNKIGERLKSAKLKQLTMAVTSRWYAASRGSACQCFCQGASAWLTSAAPKACAGQQFLFSCSQALGAAGCFLQPAV